MCDFIPIDCLSASVSSDRPIFVATSTPLPAETKACALDAAAPSERRRNQHLAGLSRPSRQGLVTRLSQLRKLPEVTEYYRRL
jgi:hypothetical protein